MFGVGFFEIVIIGVVALVFIGPKRLPEVMRQAGRLFVHVRRTANDVRSTFDQVIREAENEIRREEAETLRKALKPVTDVHAEMKSLVTGGQVAPAGTPASTASTTATPAPTAPTGAVPFAPAAPQPAAAKTDDQTAAASVAAQPSSAPTPPSSKESV